jgi:hypothetical protein
MLSHYQSTTKKPKLVFQMHQNTSQLLTFIKHHFSLFFVLFCRFFLFFGANINTKKIMSFSSIKSSIQILLLILKFFRSFLTHKWNKHTLHPLASQQLSMGNFKRLNLIDLSFGNIKIKKFVNSEK